MQTFFQKYMLSHKQRMNVQKYVQVGKYVSSEMELSGAQEWKKQLKVFYTETIEASCLSSHLIGCGGSGRKYLRVWSV